MPSRVAPGETTKELFKLMNGKSYRECCLIVHNIKQKEAFHYDQYLDRFKSSGIVARDLKKKKTIADFKTTDIYDEGIIHGKCTIVNTLHVASYMDYSRIIFVGVDLYNSMYFWTKKRTNIVKKGLREKSKHPVRKCVFGAVKHFQKHHPDVDMFTYNPKSALKRFMPVWSE